LLNLVEVVQGGGAPSSCIAAPGILATEFDLMRGIYLAELYFKRASI
jgi:hypothetical protein